MTELAVQSELERRHYRKSIPDAHRTNLDTRVRWLWNQRFGTVQAIKLNSDDVLDQTACTLILQAIMAGDLDSIAHLFRRLEGGAQFDEEVAARLEFTI
jgi:hypothetical protein